VLLRADPRAGGFGLTVDTLSMPRGLRLRPRDVVMTYEGRDGDPRDIGAEVGNDVVVEGFGAPGRGRGTAPPPG
jgi:hypothetical protein